MGHPQQQGSRIPNALWQRLMAASTLLLFSPCSPPSLWLSEDSFLCMLKFVETDGGSFWSCRPGFFCPTPRDQFPCPPGSWCGVANVKPTTCEYPVLMREQPDLTIPDVPLTVVARVYAKGDPLGGNICPPVSLPSHVVCSACRKHIHSSSPAPAQDTESHLNMSVV